jgi:hypothetical protein
MFLAIIGYAVAVLSGAVVVAPAAKKLATLTKTKKDDKVVAEITKVLDSIPVPVIRSYLAVKGVKVPDLKLPGI